ncbi:Cytolytic toxin-beta [Labeo rohita]|uniref:Cytolytic toxin-beta n=1 Tax=Labeo rohita TaxID=84645 RepID=A0ABQ8L4V5_LABRO|nr:Cytolytic toxin-beta [Labeo rohita]
MAEARISVDQNEFKCPVCLDLLKDPEDQTRVYSCPQCRQTFSPRPALARNTMLAEVVERVKKTKLPADCYAGAGDVQCDVCIGRKYKAVKSCLEMICHEHDKHLEMYCITDQQCICVLCMKYEHKNHNTASAAAQRTEKQKQLKETQRRFQQRIQWSGIVCISVSYKSISRKGGGDECGFGYNDQSWSLTCSPSRYSFRHNNEVTELLVKSISSRIGVYVDHSAGTLSFYSVSDTMSLIHTVQTTFTQPLYPGFTILYYGSVKLC